MVMNNKTNFSSSIDLIIILLLTFLLMLVVGFDLSTPIRSILGVLLVIFFPGYTLIAALFPMWGELSAVERLVLSISLSISIAFFLGFILNYTPLGITLKSTLFSIAIFVLITCIISHFRRLSYHLASQPVPWFRLNFSQYRNWCWKDKLIIHTLSLSIIAIFIAFSYNVKHLYSQVLLSNGERFTEFYLLGTNSQADNYLTKVSIGEPVSVVIGVVNNERHEVEYLLERVSDNEVDRIGKFRLEHEERWEEEYTFKPDHLGESQKTDFLLYKDGELVPSHSLHLWISVSP